MQIVRRSDLPLPRQLEGGEQRFDYQMDQLRVVITHVPYGHTQNPHRHDQLYDVTYVLEGEVEICESPDGHDADWQRLTRGDLVSFPPGPFHNMRNQSGSQAITLTLKMVHAPDLTPARFLELCLADWHGPKADTDGR